MSDAMRFGGTPEEYDGAQQSDTMYKSWPSQPAGAYDVESQDGCAGSGFYLSMPHGREDPRPCEGVVEVGREPNAS